MNDLKALKENVDKNKYVYDAVDPSLLEWFDTPPSLDKAYLEVHIEVPEFTCLCPMTGQPDFATIVIDYTPNKRCIESKALKLYMMSYRNTGMFHEACVSKMVGDLVAVLHPYSLKIQGRFTPRGGIPFWPTVDYSDD